jgi:hypothetical protein
VIEANHILGYLWVETKQLLQPPTKDLTFEQNSDLQILGRDIIMSNERTLLLMAESLRKQICEQQSIVDKLVTYAQEEGLADENL